mmetsp:Transcript_68985/g.180811  ORF Transcript_68985/g.180811 Transcript_68985/m.180811 type:complete len:218 (+) Transcript_68985:488-1141(+)
MRPAVFRCCGIVRKVFCSPVAFMKMSLGLASDGMDSSGLDCSRRAIAVFTPSSSRALPLRHFVASFRCSFRRASRSSPNLKRAVCSAPETFRGLIGAARPVSGSRATKVKRDSRKGSFAQAAFACIWISIEERPTHVTRPDSTRSSLRFGRCRYLMRSTLAVTICSGASVGSVLRQCSKATVPARASRSSKRRPGRTWPHGFRYLSTSTLLLGSLKA